MCKLGNHFLWFHLAHTKNELTYNIHTYIHVIYELDRQKIGDKTYSLHIRNTKLITFKTTDNPT